MGRRRKRDEGLQRIQLVRKENRRSPTEAEKAKALTDFWSFVDLIDFKGGRAAFSKCHKEMIAEYEQAHDECDRTLTIMPRGHLKSTLLSVAKRLHRIYQNPNIRIFVGTATKALATAFIREIQSYLEDPWLQEHVWNSRPHITGPLIPTMDRMGKGRRTVTRTIKMEGDWDDRKVVWRTDAIQVIRPAKLKEPTLVAGSVCSQATGFHFDEIIFDDIVTFENSDTPEKKERILSWTNDIESVLDPPYIDSWLEDVLPAKARYLARVGGIVDCVGTRYYSDDYWSFLIAEKDELEYTVYEKNIYVNGVDNKDGYLWPEKWNAKLENLTRKRMTEARFASQYLNQVLEETLRVLNLDKVNWLHASQYVRCGINRYRIHTKTVNGENYPIIQPIMCVDPAAGIEEGNDMTAICVGGRDQYGNLIICELRAGRWTGSDIIKQTFEVAKKWGLRAFYLETVGAFKHLTTLYRNSFQQYGPIGIIEFRPVGKKELRIAQTLEPYFRNGMVYMPGFIKSQSHIVDTFTFFPKIGYPDDPPDAMQMVAEKSTPPKIKTPTIRYKADPEYGGQQW